MFALVRHGHAGDKRAWNGPDADRPLSPRGHQQALGLVENLAPMLPTRLVSSPYLRCRQTLDPLAAHQRLDLTVDPVLAPDTSAADLDRRLRSSWVDDAVLCTHGEVMRDLRRIWEQRPLRLNGAWPVDGRTEKGAAWLVDDDAGVLTLHYFSPVHVGPVLSEIPCA